MKFYKDIYLSIMGNINLTNSWSGTGYYSMKAIQKKYKNVSGIDLDTQNISFKLRKYFWNFLSIFFLRSLGGFQYSEYCLDTIWRKKKKNLLN